MNLLKRIFALAFLLSVAAPVPAPVQAACCAVSHSCCATNSDCCNLSTAPAPRDINAPSTFTQNQFVAILIAPVVSAFVEKTSPGGIDVQQRLFFDSDVSRSHSSRSPPAA
jgi:hypothetical protein